ncbi:DUF6286 domain-containing protein [Streptomyces sp. Je 1-332]|uniref:DUF6286 domain-containing protein n=1 Tax=Streptomyces sp. Je 1-332 TaxID=3231270 RepID=UPI003459478F
MTTPAAERGTTTVADRAVRRIAQRAATEALAPGAVEVEGGAAAVRGRRAQVGVTVTLPYPAVLDEAGESVRAHVTERTERLTGLTVSSARIRVRGLSRGLARRELPAGQLAPPVEAAGRAHRPWSQRRLPVGVLTLLAAAVCGVLLYDVVSVHAAGQAPARWRVRAMEWLGTHGPYGGTTSGVLAAIAVFALGVWLLVLALAPGRRGVLPMRPPLPGVRAAVDRRAVAVLLRDAVTGVPGVGRVRVRVGRRTARVRAGLEFGELEGARRAVAETAEATTTDLALAGPLRLRVRLRTAPGWRAPAGAGAGSGPESGAGSGSRAGAGPGRGTGSVPDAGSDPGAESRPWSGAGSRNGPGSGAGSEARPGPGAGSEPEAEPGCGPVPEAGSGPGAETGPGRGAGPWSGAEAGSGPGVRERSGPDEPNP